MLVLKILRIFAITIYKSHQYDERRYVQIVLQFYKTGVLLNRCSWWGNFFCVDKYRIQKFCIGNNISETELLNSARIEFRKYSHTQEQILGLLAIQLYAASLRKEEYLYSSRNYTIRLRKLLNWDDNDLKNWMSTYQDDYWRMFYNWCSSHGFFWVWI